MVLPEALCSWPQAACCFWLACFQLDLFPNPPLSKAETILLDVQCGPGAEMGNGAAARGPRTVVLKESSFLLQKAVLRATERAFKGRDILELDSETEFREGIGERCS